MHDRFSLAAGLALGLSLILDASLIFVDRNWVGTVALVGVLSLASATGFLLLARRRERRKEQEHRAGQDDLWATMADGLAKLAAGNLAWTLKPKGDLRDEPLAADCIQAFNDVTAEPCRRLFYVGSDSQMEGQLAGCAIGQALRRGRLAVLVGSFDGVNFELRRKGALTELRENFPEIHETVLLESRVDPDHAYQQVKRLLATDPHLGAIYVTEGGSAGGIVRALVEAGRTEVSVVAHDLDTATMNALEKGQVAATIFQDPFAQGFDPAVRLFNHLITGQTPPTSRLATKVRIVTRENSAEFWDHRQNRSVSGDRSRLVVPAPNPAKRRVRIAFVALADTGFWTEVKSGAMEARAALEPLGGDVEWIVPPGKDEPDRIAHLGQTIREITAAKYDALALPLHDRALVPPVNQAVGAGLVVGTYNTEPLSLRQAMSTVLAQAKLQLSLSADLDAQAQKGEQSARKIASSLSLVTEGLGRQKSQVSQTGTDLETLGATLKTIDSAARASGQATQTVGHAAADSAKSVQESLTAMNSLSTSSKAIARSVEELKLEMDKIAENVNFIGDIANRTNTLAINASIEAARNGAAGKGFAVIASEIRHLSDQANAAAGSISALLESIGAKVGHVETTTQTAMEDSRRTHDLAVSSELSMSLIGHASQESESKMEVILAAVQDVVSFSNQIGTVVNVLKQTNDEWNSALAASLASTEEMTLVADKIALDARMLSDRTRSQEGMLRQFKLGEE